MIAAKLFCNWKLKVKAFFHRGGNCSVRNIRFLIVEIVNDCVSL